MLQPLLEIRHISKSFPGVHALDNVSLDVYAGEVHVVLGENGAGKSTLMKILTGVYQKDVGEIFLRGEQVEISDPIAARVAGISIIYQEFNLFPHLSVAQNIFICREPRYFRYFLNETQLNREASDILDMLGYALDPTAKIQTLSVAEQQMVEIAKAISIQSDILIMDEPTAALSEEEIETLFETVRRLRAQKKGIIYISHRLTELESIADRVTVLRDGQHIRTSKYADTNLKELIKLMVGREINDIYPARKQQAGRELLRVEGLQRSPRLKGLSFSLHAGEILGVAGLVGAGRTETMRAIVGADARVAGKIFLSDREIQIRTPIDAINYGIAYLTEDRKREGLALNLNVIHNVTMAHIPSLSKFGIMNDAACLQETEEFVHTLQIKTPRLEQKVIHLSGGNQQKVIVARWLCTHCRILIFDEPTRGIDVGAKREIYDIINQLTTEGASVIMLSSELNEIIGMSDRVMVMHAGAVAGFLDRKDVTQERIMALATGHAEGN